MTDTSPRLSVADQPGKPRPDAKQKRFNNLLKKIETHRRTLEAWNNAEQVYLKCWIEDFVPLLKETERCELEMLRTLDKAAARLKLSKKDLNTLHDYVYELAENLLDSGSDHKEELMQVRARHSAIDPKLFGEDEAQHMKDFPFETPDDIDKAPPKDTEPKKKTALEARQDVERTKSNLAVRDVYRKLVSALHPDRETDDTERQRKTALMQRVNEAYTEKDLLSLLHLQLEIEQIDQDHISQLPKERIKHYNRVLAEQVKELETEIAQRSKTFRTWFMLGPCPATNPATIERTCTLRLRDLREELGHLETELDELQDSKNIKAWLLEQREMREQVQDEWELWMS